MPSPRQTALCRYHFDAVDRLASAASDSGLTLQRFYRNQRLCTEQEGQQSRSIFEHDSQPLAERSNDVALLATDQQGSVLQVQRSASNHALVYGPYGGHAGAGLPSLLGFNAERPDPVTGHYPLGNGYRWFIPGLMRFNSPDSWSPFGKGGLNTYAYCLNNPVNQSDPSGHGVFSSILKIFGKKALGKAAKAAAKTTTSKAVASAAPVGTSALEGLADVPFGEVMKYLPLKDRGRLAQTSLTMLERVEDFSRYSLPELKGGNAYDPDIIKTIKSFYKHAPKEQYSAFESQLVRHNISPSARLHMSPRVGFPDAKTSRKELKWSRILKARQDIRESIDRVNARLGIEL